MKKFVVSQVREEVCFKNRSGVVLVTAVVLLAAVMMIGAALFVSSTMEVKHAYRTRNAQRVFFNADAMANATIAMLTQLAKEGPVSDGELGDRLGLKYGGLFKVSIKSGEKAFYNEDFNDHDSQDNPTEADIIFSVRTDNGGYKDIGWVDVDKTSSMTGEVSSGMDATYNDGTQSADPESTGTMYLIRVLSVSPFSGGETMRIAVFCFIKG